MLEPFSLPFVQRGVLEVLLLAPAAGLLGTWIVLRGQAFFVHAAGTAAFPGLVVADGIGLAAPLGALGAAGSFALLVTALGRRRREGQDAVVAVALVACLATGAILASDVFESGARVESLLFGSLLLVGTGDLVLAGCCSAAAVTLSLLLGERWLARGFDSEGADALGLRSALPTLVLLGLLAVSAVAALDAVGALLVSALFVVPAATTRLVCRRLATWRLASITLVAVEGVAGLWLSVETNTPPGAAIAMVAGGVFAAVAALRALGPRPAPAMAALAALALAGCGASSSSDPDVVVSTPPLADVTRAIAGPDVDVVQILHPNTDPHEYEPRPRDILDTADAQLVIVSGDGLDGWMDKVVDEAGGDPVVLDAGKDLPHPLAGDGDDAVDPHWWHDPRNVMAAADRIEDALIRAGLGDARQIRASARRYTARVSALDREIERCFAAVPKAERKVVTDHDALGYFARRYGIQVVGAVIPAQSTQAQASAGDLAELSETIRREHVRAVFPESSVNDEVAKALAQQTGASADYELYGDSLGPVGSDGATYLGMERSNADAIMRGLTGGRRGCRIEGTA
jgi:ABC-type Zn uptake system ZnuABC Zn-binding protein ZnuA/ABC-type Mn2+/Zn2+ transport system permease subunit